MSASLYRQVCLQGLFFMLAYDLCRFPVIPLFAQRLGLPPEAIGFAVAASTITGIFGKFLFGGLSDILGRKGMMVAACLVVTILPGFYFLAEGAGALITLRLFHGLGTAILAPVGRALVSDIIPVDRRGNQMATYTASMNLGTMAGRSLGGFLLFLGGYSYPFFASALAGALSLAIVWRWPAQPRNRFALQDLVRKMIKGFREVGSNVAILATSCVEATQYFALGAVDTFLPLYAKEAARLTEWQLGLLYGIQMGTVILLKPFMGWISDRVGRRPQIIVGLLLAGGVVWRIPWEETFLTLSLLVVLLGVAVSMTASASAAFVTDLCTKRNYGSAHGVFGTIMDAGHAAGPIVAGFLVGLLGFRPCFAIYTTVLILASLSFAFLVRRGESSP